MRATAPPSATSRCCASPRLTIRSWCWSTAPECLRAIAARGSGRTRGRRSRHAAVMMVSASPAKPWLRRDGDKTKAMSRRIYFDGHTLSLERGTGITTYTRKLAQIVRGLGFEVGVVYSSPRRPAKNPKLREISFLNTRDTAPVPYAKKVWDTICDQVRCPFGLEPSAVGLTGTTIADQLRDRLPLHDHLFVARNLFANARRHSSWSGRFIELNFDTAPDILHCTYQLQLRARRARNVYTIHDLVPLRLPYATLDN